MNHPRISPCARIAFLTCVLLPLWTRPGLAHSLEGVFVVYPLEKKVRVDACYSTGAVPKNAKVRVFRADDTDLLDEPGKLNAQGWLLFPYEKAEDLRVEISAGAGHSKTLHISAAQLSGAAVGAAPGGAIKDVLLGLALILAAAAFAIALRNRRRLRELTRRPPSA